jgi:hypothetical protein
MLLCAPALVSAQPAAPSGVADVTAGIAVEAAQVAYVLFENAGSETLPAHPARHPPAAHTFSRALAEPTTLSNQRGSAAISQKVALRYVREG